MSVRFIGSDIDARRLELLGTTSFSGTAEFSSAVSLFDSWLKYAESIFDEVVRDSVNKRLTKLDYLY